MHPLSVTYRHPGNFGVPSMYWQDRQEPKRSPYYVFTHTCPILSDIERAHERLIQKS